VDYPEADAAGVRHALQFITHNTARGVRVLRREMLEQDFDPGSWFVRPTAIAPSWHRADQGV
jgi:hypothetical protein